MNTDITGLWRGAYWYSEPVEIANREPTEFTLTLERGWLGRFSGTVVDEETLGMPGVGTIKGRVSCPRLTFVKQMPVCYVASGNNRAITLREFAIEHGIPCQREYPHMPIRYEGNFSTPFQASGTWTMRPANVNLGNGMAINLVGSQGQWKIQR